MFSVVRFKADLKQQPIRHYLLEIDIQSIHIKHNIKANIIGIVTDAIALMIRMNGGVEVGISDMM